jgi:hypothetical protein
VKADPDHAPGLDLHLLRVVDVEVPDLEPAFVHGAIDDWTHFRQPPAADGRFPHPGQALMQAGPGNKPRIKDGRKVSEQPRFFVRHRTDIVFDHRPLQGGSTSIADR